MNTPIILVIIIIVYYIVHKRDFQNRGENRGTDRETKSFQTRFISETQSNSYTEGLL